MCQVLNFVQGHLFFNNFNAQNYGVSLTLLPHKSCFPNRKRGVQFLLQVNSKLVNHIEHSLPDNKAEACDGDELYSFPHIQTLKEFPKEELFRKVVYVGSGDINLRHSSAESVAEFLSSMLKLKVVQKKLVSRSMHSQMEYGENSDILLLENLSDFKMELANCSKFAKELASGVDIFVNDAFSQSHKVLASTIGGSDLAGKAAALQFLASKCDAIVFVGSMAFQIMHAMGVPVPVKLVELGALNEAVSIVESANSRNIPIVLPKDFWCMNDVFPTQLEIFSVNSILDGWQPVDLGPLSLQEIIPFAFKMQGAYRVLKISQDKNDNFVKSASVVWEFLKGRNLPGLLALDRAYPFDIDWDIAYADPMQPLVVDVGSGNGLFLFGMARRRKDLNFLGLEINEKLVKRCLDHVHQSGMQNGYFITTNATSTFRSIVSSYPGDLVLVSIQCPNPDFNNPEYRWRMLQRSLVEAIADLLTFGGKVFLQSDIEAVAVRMKREFIEYGKGKLVLLHDSETDSVHQRGRLTENPFGVRSDWEQHLSLEKYACGAVAIHLSLRCWERFVGIVIHEFPKTVLNWHLFLDVFPCNYVPTEADLPKQSSKHIQLAPFGTSLIKKENNNNNNNALSWHMDLELDFMVKTVIQKVDLFRLSASRFLLKPPSREPNEVLFFEALFTYIKLFKWCFRHSLLKEVGKPEQNDRTNRRKSL
ncbi:uncharacterized protein Fot_32968 [Forsythia ovata]|uniref:Phosphoglycerate kinase n=1 Tax=Forsythia ovata TaxID=205694 RepID=A0ABD1T9J2_9LAMI